MAYTKKTNIANENQKKQDENFIKENDTVSNEEPSKQKKFNNTDKIPCSSIFPGELLINGLRTGLLYRWVNYGDVVEVEYQDLIASIRAANPISAVMRPYFIILDNDVVEQNPTIKKLYNSLYKDAELREILNLTPSDIKRIVPTLPSGAVEALKTIASTMIGSGTLDSINKIKALDEVFGTQLILLTNLFNN